MDKLAISLAGHDKGHIYAVVKEEDGALFLADGKGKTLENPKRKNPRHVQTVLHLPEEITGLLESVGSDSDLVHILRLYERRMKNSPDDTDNVSGTR